VPGRPSSVYFPVVTQSTAQLVWHEPIQPNGVITGYRVAYGIRSDPQTFGVTIDSLDSLQQDYFATNMDAYKYYVFEVAAKTQFGWGEAVRVLVYTMTNRSTFYFTE
jgi:protein sidekick